MDYAKLKAELDKAAYAGKTDAEAAAMLNAKAITGLPRLLTNKEYLDALSQASIQKAQETAEDANAQGNAAAVAVDQYLLTVGQIEVATGSPCRAALDVLVTKNVITAAELAAMVAKAATTYSVADEQGFGVATDTDVALARGTRPLVQMEVSHG